MDTSILNKEKEYKDYIDEHRSNVWNSYVKLSPLFVSLIDEIKDTPGMINMLKVNVLHHDLSKYSTEEFDAYRREFHSVSDEEKTANKEKFDAAWVHHYSTNKHHWNYWFDLKTKKKTPMDLISILEMIIDWDAMGTKFGDNPKQYYDKKKDTIMLHPETLDTLEFLLLILYRD